MPFVTARDHCAQRAVRIALTTRPTGQKGTILEQRSNSYSTIYALRYVRPHAVTTALVEQQGLAAQCYVICVSLTVLYLRAFGSKPPFLSGFRFSLLGLSILLLYPEECYALAWDLLGLLWYHDKIYTAFYISISSKTVFEKVRSLFYNCFILNIVLIYYRSNL